MAKSINKRQRSVLYIEDNPDTLAMVQHLLETELNVICDVATTSAGAEQRLNASCYDLIISDYNIPGEIGTTIADRVLERDSQQPFMIITEYMTPGVRVYCQAKNIPLLGKFSTEKITSFLAQVSRMLEEHYCENRRKKPTSAISITSPHVLEAQDSLLKEQAQGQRSTCLD